MRHTFTKRGHFDRSKITHALAYSFWEIWDNWPRDFRWWLAGWLCRIACWLRGHRWYVADAWHGLPGNRISELRQQIWQNAILVAPLSSQDDETKHRLDHLDRALAELAQAAGEAWGHIE